VERPEAVYIGLRGPQLPFGHGGPTVVGVRDEAGDRRLRKHPDARVLVDKFEWGYQGAGPGALAEAILADRLGFNPEPEVSTAFAREVVSGLESDSSSPGTKSTSRSRAGFPRRGGGDSPACESVAQPCASRSRATRY
jgi:hypothetical protein